MSQKQDQPFPLSLSPSLRVDFQGSRVTSDSSRLLVCELEERLGLSTCIFEDLNDDPRGKSAHLPLPNLAAEVAMPRGILVLLALFAFNSFLFAQAPPAIPAQAQAAMKDLRKERFRAHMAFLADDLLEGRGTGTRGHELAARYVAAQFEAMGLNPAGEGGTYYQRVPLLEVMVDSQKCAVSITENGSPSELKWGDDFIVLGRAGTADASVEGSVVFAGYGVRTPDGHYDNYSGVAVKGKIVAVLAGGPSSLQNEVRAHLGSVPEKMRLARDRGAIGMILLRPPQAEESLPWARLVAMAGLPAMSWIDAQGQRTDAYSEIPVFARFSQAASERLFQHASKSWTDVLRDADASKPQSFPLPVTARLQQVIHPPKENSSPNVVAVLLGSDPRLSHEYVVYSAHLDHLGIGTPVSGDSIYNGAVDDASGTAALLAIAEAFKSLPRAPARSILFLATTGEEKGDHVGASYFVHFPPVPIHNIVADLNMDWASVFYTFDEVVALGAEHSTLGHIVERNAARLGLKLVPDPHPEEQSFIGGDEYTFVLQGVPAIMIAEGVKAREPKVDANKLNEEYGAHYHAPSDDMKQAFNFDASVEFMQLNFLVGYDIAQNPQRPAWKKDDFFGDTFGRK